MVHLYVPAYDNSSLCAHHMSVSVAVTKHSTTMMQQLLIKMTWQHESNMRVTVSSAFLLQMMMEELNKVVQRKEGQNKAAAPATSSPVDRKRKRIEQTDVVTEVPLTALTKPPESA